MYGCVRKHEPVSPVSPVFRIVVQKGVGLLGATFGTLWFVRLVRSVQEPSDPVQ